MDTLAREFEGFSFLRQIHGSLKVGEMIEGACEPDGDRAGSIEREEPDAGLALEGDIGTDVEFVEGA